MAVVVPKKSYTIDDLWDLSHRSGKRYELVRGELRELAPTAPEHGFVESNVTSLLREHVRAVQAGIVVSGEVGFILQEGETPTVRAADIAFIPHAKLLAEGIPRRYAPFVPDLVVEVLSPSDTFTLVMEKVNDWLNAGVKVVWVVDPATRQVSIHRAGQPVHILSESDTLSGEEVLPGFECIVSELFSL